MKTPKNKAADKLRVKQRKLRLQLDAVTSELDAIRRKCKHQFLLTGFDSKYFYASCHCHRAIRYEHFHGDNMPVAEAKFRESKAKGIQAAPTNSQIYEIGY